VRITIIGAVLLITLSGACADAQPAAGVDNALSQLVARTSWSVASPSSGTAPA
jgi:hypothetical protein